MEKIPEEQINSRMASLPPIIKNAISNSNWEEKIRRIVSMNNLRVDQGAVIEEITRLTMFGFEDPKNYLQKIVHEANIKEDVGRKITTDVGEEIFQPIKDAIIRDTRQNSGLPGDQDEIDEIIYGEDNVKLDIYDVESSLENNVEEEEEETQEEQDNLGEVEVSREEVTEELKKDIEILPNVVENKEIDKMDEVEKLDAEDLMSKKLKNTVSTEKEDQKVDPYRESII